MINSKGIVFGLDRNQIVKSAALYGDAPLDNLSTARNFVRQGCASTKSFKSGDPKIENYIQSMHFGLPVEVYERGEVDE